MVLILHLSCARKSHRDFLPFVRLGFGMQYLLLRGLLYQQQECSFLCIWNRFCTDQSVKVKNSLDYGKLSAAAERAIKTRHSLQLWCPAVISDVKVQMCSLKMLFVMSTMMQLHQHLFTLHFAGQVSEAQNSRFVSELCQTSARTGSSVITTASAIYQPPKGARTGRRHKSTGMDIPPVHPFQHGQNWL